MEALGVIREYLAPFRVDRVASSLNRLEPARTRVKNIYKLVGLLNSAPGLRLNRRVDVQPRPAESRNQLKWFKRHLTRQDTE